MDTSSVFLNEMPRLFSYIAGLIPHRDYGAIAPTPPWSYCLGALEMQHKNVQFPHKVPFTNEKMPWCPYPFKTKHTRLIQFFYKQSTISQLQGHQFLLTKYATKFLLQNGPMLCTYTIR